jgi:hypothetical protein
MNFILSKIALALTLFNPFAHAAQPERITITAQTMTAHECLDTFYKDLPADRIYPIRLSIHNESDNAIIFSRDQIKALQSTILTSKSIESEISTLACASVFLIILLPLALAGFHLINQLKELLPIIQKFSPGESPLEIESGTTFDTIIFVRFESPKDAEGKTQSYVAPQSLNIAIPLLFNDWSRGNTTFNLDIPVRK